MNVRLVGIALVATMLAGCSDDPAPTGPTGQIDGAVIDHLMRPFAQAVVLHVESGQTTETTDLGGFSFFDVPVGFHTLEVTIDGIGTDRELVVVEADHTTKIILQVYDIPDPGPYVAQLAHRARVQLAEPGTECIECGWSAKLHERPEAAVIWAVWDPTFAPGLETHLIIEAFDEHGHRILAPQGEPDEVDADGRTMLRAVIPGEQIPEDAHRISVTVKFDPKNDAPQLDFQLETFLELHYGMTDEVTQLLA